MDVALRTELDNLRRTIDAVVVDARQIPSQTSMQCLDRVLALVDHAHRRLDVLEAELRRLSGPAPTPQPPSGR
jgi:hypothetical protein